MLNVYLHVCTHTHTLSPGSGSVTGYEQKHEEAVCLTPLWYNEGKSRLLLETINLKLSFSRLLALSLPGREETGEEKKTDRKYAKSNTNTIQIRQPNSFKQIACNPHQVGERSAGLGIGRLSITQESCTTRAFVSCCCCLSFQATVKNSVRKYADAALITALIS